MTSRYLRDSAGKDSAKVAGLASLSMAGVALTLAALNRIIATSAPPILPPLESTPQPFAWSEGDISYSAEGHGPAVILLHGIYAGASSFEFRRVFTPLATRFRVFAPDLPGFGLSSRASRVYTPELYITAIRDFAQQVAGASDHPVSIVASSLTSAFAIDAALTRPDLFNRLVLIEPTGFETLSQPATIGQKVIGSLLRAPLIGDSLYNALVSRPGLRYFLSKQVYHRADAVSDDLVDAYYATSHQPRARYAAASFIGGNLNLDIADSYEALTQPVLICWGRDSSFTPLEYAKPFVEHNTNADLMVFERSGALPHDEEAESFARQVGNWIAQGISTSRR